MDLREYLSKEGYFLEELEEDSFQIIKIKKKLYSGKTPYQKIEILETPFLGRMLVLDGLIQTTEKDDFLYHESLVHPAMLAHPSPEKVLLIGGGDGGALREVLKYPVKEVFLVDLDKQVVEVAKKYLKKIHQDSFEDKRVKLIFEDGRVFLENTSNKFDVLILDLIDCFGPAKKLYTQEFYQIVKKKLTKKGLLSLHCNSPFEYPQTFATLVRTVSSVFKEKILFETFIPSYGFSLSFCLASQHPLKINAEGIKKLPQIRYFHPSLLKGLSLPLYAQELLKEKGTISTDRLPFDWQKKNI